MDGRLTERLDIRVTPTLKYQLWELGHRIGTKPTDLSRLGIYLLVEKYSPGCGRELEEELYKEIGRLGIRDNFVLYDGDPEKDGSEVSWREVNKWPRFYANPNYKRSRWDTKVFDLWIQLAEQGFVDPRQLLNDLESQKPIPEDYPQLAKLQKLEDELRSRLEQK